MAATGADVTRGGAMIEEPMTGGAMTGEVMTAGAEREGVRPGEGNTRGVMTEGAIAGDTEALADAAAAAGS